MGGLGFRKVLIQTLTITGTSPSPYAEDEGKSLPKTLFLCSPEQVENLVDAELPVLKSAQNYLDISIQCKIYCYFYMYFQSPIFAILESRNSGKVLLRLGGMLCCGN